MVRTIKRKRTAKRKPGTNSANKWKPAGANRNTPEKFLVGYINIAKNPKYKMREIAFNATTGNATVMYFKGMGSSVPAKSFKVKLTQKAMKSIRKYFDI